MKKDEVPQDGDNLHHGTFKQLFYAVDASGDYTPVSSVGWEPENVALGQAWEEVEHRVEATRGKVASGELSPVAFYMERTLLDLPLLARKVGKFQWQVKRHMKPAVFKNLSADMLAKYAAVFGIAAETLQKGELLPFQRPE
ncbi:hypothetical protein DLD77_03005 [Chitinophaga alhagiae]|uniref:XRE family transcriptional regulator n=1 Tax=Chitinophaga alhagiae TaxID=2203219 RepID=A0ABM6WA54_9BACT|nr:hypothetical protein [Chitinophaga alhagiae]AWO00738.1 hypothetical protein DLD77_03005 [Chitinophaga alhagiae]